MAEEDIADFTLEDEKVVLDTDEGLAKQDLSRINLDDLNVDTFEVMSRQATINVGTIGHVAHGKSTVVKALSGVKTQKFHREAVMNITIHLGYANAKVYQCASCPRPSCFQTYPSSQPDQTPCPNCGEPMMLKRHFSFVDCPGHDVLMATMLNGAAIMDSALLLIAANESFPQPQTLEHLAAAEMIGVTSLIVLQSKVDLVSKEHALAQHSIIHYYLATKTAYPEAAVIPICAQRSLNIDFLLDHLVRLPLPQRQLRSVPHLSILRSFDLSLPGPVGEAALAVHGGVVGGTVAAGVLCVGDDIEILPGLLVLRRRDGVLPRQRDVLEGREVVYVASPPPGEWYSVPLRTTVVQLQAERNRLQFAIPGGLIAIATTLDPSLTRQNRLRGQVVRVVRRGPLWSSSRFGDVAKPGGATASQEDPPDEAGTPTEAAVSMASGGISKESASPCSGDSASIYASSSFSGLSARVNGETGLRVYQEVRIRFFLLREVLGVAAVRPDGTGPYLREAHSDRHASSTRSLPRRIAPLREGESIILNVGTLTTAATVLRTSRHAGRAVCQLESPLAADPPQQRIVLARYIDRKVRVIGWGTIDKGVPVKHLPA